MKPGHQTNGNARVMCFENPKGAYNPECSIVVQYSVGPIITLHG
jgi:hypothetical protein